MCCRLSKENGRSLTHTVQEEVRICRTFVQQKVCTEEELLLEFVILWVYESFCLLSLLVSGIVICLLSLLVSGIVELSGLWMEKEMQDCVQWEDIDLRSDELTICRIGLLASGVNPNGLWMEKEKRDLGVVRRKWPWDMNWQSADWSSRRSWWRSQGNGTWSYSKARSHLDCQFQNTFLDPPMLAPPRHPHFWTSFKSKMQRVLSVCEYLANLLLGFVIMLEHLLRLTG